MKFYGIDCLGDFKTQRTDSLSPATSADEARIVYDKERKKLLYADDSKWRSFSDFGTVVTDFSNGDTLYPDHFYYINTISSPLSGSLSNDVVDGDVVSILDEMGTFSTNSFTVATSASILGTSTYECSTSNQLIQFIYTENNGWRVNLGGASSGGSGGAGIYYLEIKPNEMTFDDLKSGVSPNSLWGIIPCIDLDNNESGAFWATTKAPTCFDYNKDTIIKMVYNNGSNVIGDINLNSKIWIINSINDGNSILESNPDITNNLILSVNEYNKLQETTIATINGGVTTYPLYFSIYFERDISINDTYNGPLQLVSLIIYQE